MIGGGRVSTRADRMIDGGRVSARIVAELAIAVVLFGVAASWGTSYWRASLRAGRQPAFYQQYFEPAVMMACGHGFRLASPPVPAVVEFLQLKRDSLSCSDIPAGTEITDRHLVQKAWMYLLASVALAWRVLGISWSGLGPLFGVFFGATIVAAYAIFRLGMNRIIAIGGAAALMVSAVHLQNLPHLRDYAKAPFTLVLFALLGLLVARELTVKRLLAVAVAYGATLGIGYGFRTDFLVEIPLFPIVVLGFLPGGVLRRLPVKFAAIGVCTATFMALAWPILTTVQQRGGCQWHAVLLGLIDGPSDALMVSRGPYSFGHEFSDDFVYATATAFAVRTQPGVGHIEYCSHEYDGITGRYVMSLVQAFPGDFITRAFASVVQVVQLPFRWFDQPLPGWWTNLYAVRRLVLRPLRGWGVLPVAITLLGLTAADPRVGLFALFFLLYVGGYPSLQFDIRHYFHLEFMTWWAIGFVVQQVVVHRRRAEGRWRTMFGQIRERYEWRRATRALAAIAVCLLGALWLARGYQQVHVARLFRGYLDAPREAVRIADTHAGIVNAVPVRGRTDLDPMPAAMLEVDLDRAHCSTESGVTVRYRAPFDQFEHRVQTGGDPATGTTRVFEPVFGGFEGLAIDHAGPGCVKGVYRMLTPERAPLLLSVQLADGWERRRLYQTLAPWRWRS